ncbi:ATP-binding protein, partial [Shewanella sp. 0m-11]
SLINISQDLFEMADAMAEFNGQSLKLSTGEEFQVSGDKYLLFQALFNLVDNAIKYSGEGAEISISQNRNVISIQDNGPGIPETSREKVFERLVRLDPSRHHKGTGLGLSMVKAILSRHNAKIALTDNQPGLKVIITF